MTSVTAA